MKTFDRCLVGARIRELRQEKNICQNTLAKNINVSNASISYWETAKQEPGAFALFKMAQYFEVTVDYLIGLED
jgi:transcriptional regulator with XRE-family HTH domain